MSYINIYNKKLIKAYQKNKIQESDKWEPGNCDQIQQEENDFRMKRQKNKIRKKRMNNELLYDNSIGHLNQGTICDCLSWSYDNIEYKHNQSLACINHGINSRKKHKNQTIELNSIQENQCASTTTKKLLLDIMEDNKGEVEAIESMTMDSVTSQESLLNTNEETERFMTQDNLRNIGDRDNNKNRQNTMLSSSLEANQQPLLVNIPDNIYSNDNRLQIYNVNIIIQNGYSTKKFKFYYNIDDTNNDDNDDDDDNNNYEDLLDELCQENSIKGSFALHLKIYILKQMKINEVFLNRKLAKLYDKLLDINYKLIFHHNHDHPNDTSILPYIDTNQISKKKDLIKYSYIQKKK